MYIIDMKWWEFSLLLIIFTICLVIIVKVLNGFRKDFVLKGKGGKSVLIKSPSKESLHSDEEKRDSFDIKSSSDKIQASGGRHIDCPYVRDFLIVIKKSILLGEKIYSLTEVATIRDQMFIVQFKFDQIKGMAIRGFTDLLMKINGKEVNLLHNLSFVIFRSQVVDEISKAMVKIKNLFQVNHLSELSDKAYDEFVEEQVGVIVSEAISDMEMLYPPSLVPSWKDIVSSVSKLDIDCGLQLIRECFYSAREISIRNKKQVEEMEEEFQEECRSLIGIRDPIEF